MVRKRAKEVKVFKERRIDEESLYYILERDLDREAIFANHDGWYSQVPFGKGKRIDYIVKYGDRVYGIEVKKDFPTVKHFEQAERYRNALNGVFLAYPSDWVGQAVYVSEIKETKFLDVGLISLTLYRSHVIRKAKQNERQSHQIWNDLLLDDKEYLSHAHEKWVLEQSDRLSETALADSCFWVSFNRRYEECDELSRFSFQRSDWIGLGLLYGASYATSLHKYFSLDNLWNDFCKDMGWKSFSLEKLEFTGLASQRSYGNLLWMWKLSEASIFFMDKVRKALRVHLGQKDWTRLTEKIEEWRLKHKKAQSRCEKEFVKE